jgi:hypothetical protein
MKKQTLLSFFIVIIVGSIIGMIYFHFFYYEKPEKALNDALAYVTQQNEEAAEKYLDYQKLYGSQSDSEIYQAIMRDFSYEVKAVKQDGASAEATVTVSNRNMETIYGQFVVDAYQRVIEDAYQPEETRKDQTELKQELDDLLVSYLTDGETDIRSEEITIQMSRVGRSWYLNLDDDNLDAIYGGYLTAKQAADNVLGDLSTEALDNLEAAYQQKINDADHVLRNAVHYIVDDIWNDRLCNIVSCINAGTDTEGQDYDIEAGMQDLDEKLQELDECDDYIMELDDVNYSEIKTQ